MTLLPRDGPEYRLVPERVGFIVGLAAEARLLRPLACRVAIGGGTPAGARAAADRLAADGATALASFGLAGGLDPALVPGAVLVPTSVLTGDVRLPTDPALARALGGATPHALLAADSVVAEAGAKSRLWRETGCAAVDLESGAVAEVARTRSLPFAVLRAVCDPAARDLPSAALAALDARGAIGVGRVLAALAARPGQIPALLALARDAAAARRELARRVRRLRDDPDWCRPG